MMDDGWMPGVVLSSPLQSEEKLSCPVCRYDRCLVAAQPRCRRERQRQRESGGFVPQERRSRRTNNPGRRASRRSIYVLPEMLQPETIELLSLFAGVSFLFFFLFPSRYFSAFPSSFFLFSFQGMEEAQRWDVRQLDRGQSKSKKKISLLPCFFLRLSLFLIQAFYRRIDTGDFLYSF